MPENERNAVWLLFSSKKEHVEYGGSKYIRRNPDFSGILGILFGRYREEGYSMGYTVEDFKKDQARFFLGKITPEERRELLNELPPEERLRGLPPEEIEAYLKQLKESRGEA